MGNNSEDSPNQGAEEELRIGAWKGIIFRLQALGYALNHGNTSGLNQNSYLQT